MVAVCHLTTGGPQFLTSGTEEASDRVMGPELEVLRDRSPVLLFDGKGNKGEFFFVFLSCIVVFEVFFMKEMCQMLPEQLDSI